MTKELINKIVTTVLLLFMPLSTYVTFNESITIADVILFLTLLLAIFFIFTTSRYDKSIKIEIALPLVIYIIYILISRLLLWGNDITNFNDQVLSFIRYLFYIIAISFLSKNFFDKKFGYNLYKKLALLFACYTLLQYIAFHLFGRLLPANVLGLPTSSEVTKLYTTTYLSYYTTGLILFRPYSVFIEPSYYSIYQIPILFMILNNKNEKNKFLIAAFITFTFFLAGSTTGIVLGLLCWIKPLYNKLVKNINIKFVLCLIISIPFIIGFLTSDAMQKSLSRIIQEDGSAGSSITGRFYGIESSFENQTLKQKVFGNGIGSNNEYLPSYQLIVYFFGYTGVIVLVIIALLTYFKLNKIGKNIMILLLISMIGTASLFNITSVLYLSLIYTNYNTKALTEREKKYE